MKDIHDHALISNTTEDPLPSLVTKPIIPNRGEDYCEILKATQEITYSWMEKTNVKIGK